MVKKSAKKPAKPPSEAPAKDSSSMVADALNEIAGEIQPLYHLSDLVDRVGDLSYNLGWLARSQTLAAIAQFGNEGQRQWALERLKRLVED